MEGSTLNAFNHRFRLLKPCIFNPDGRIMYPTPHNLWFYIGKSASDKDRRRSPEVRG
uniref:Uncharacterized protein n=1 Tax=Picea glauca TaxID=3330 RepID=A0A101M4J3_PICGL|nr:hypothetical protein ABT39_MTgene797 [Picea glauca]